MCVRVDATPTVHEGGRDGGRAGSGLLAALEIAGARRRGERGREEGSGRGRWGGGRAKELYAWHAMRSEALLRILAPVVVVEHVGGDRQPTFDAVREIRG